MTHLAEGDILALRDEGAAEPGLRAHVDRCIPCRNALAEAHRRAAAIDDLLAADRDRVDVAAAKARVRARLDRERSREVRRATRGRHLRRAAAILALTAGAAYALPRTPIGAWLWPQSGPVGHTPAPAGEGTAAPEQEIVLVPVGDGIEIVLDEVTPGTEVEVVWLEGNTARLTAGPGARYSIGDGVARASTPVGPVRIGIPRSAARISVTINGRMVYEGTGSEGEDRQVVSRSDSGIVFLASMP